MKKLINYIIFLILVGAFNVACTLPDDDNPITISCEDSLENLQNLKIIIEDFASNSVCGDDFECRYIAFGTKPCGGPWYYLVYSTSIDTNELEALVADYNEREHNYNFSCGAISDCSVPIPPSGFSCEDNQCIPLF